MKYVLNELCLHNILGVACQDAWNCYIHKQLMEGQIHVEDKPKISLIYKVRTSEFHLKFKFANSVGGTSWLQVSQSSQSVWKHILWVLNRGTVICFHQEMQTTILRRTQHKGYAL